MSTREDDSPNASSAKQVHKPPAPLSLVKGALLTLTFCLVFGFCFCRIRLDIEPDAVYLRMLWGPIGVALSCVAITWSLSKLGAPLSFRIGQLTIEEAIVVTLIFMWAVISTLLANIGQPIR